MLVGLVDQETAQRGFLITGIDRFLFPYREGGWRSSDTSPPPTGSLDRNRMVVAGAASRATWALEVDRATTRSTPWSTHRRDVPGVGGLGVDLAGSSASSVRF